MNLELSNRIKCDRYTVDRHSAIREILLRLTHTVHNNGIIFFMVMIYQRVIILREINNSTVARESKHF